MNIIIIPKIEASTGGIRCFDMNFAYSYDVAKSFLGSISEEGRRIYLTRQLPLDFVYPVFYTMFFVLALQKLTYNKKAVCILPVLLAAADYTENICTVIMLKSASLSPALAAFASAVTAAKTVLMYVIILIIIVLFVKRIIKNKKKKA